MHLGPKRCSEGLGHARVGAQRRHRLVGGELRHDVKTGRHVEWLDTVVDRGDGPLEGAGIGPTC